MKKIILGILIVVVVIGLIGFNYQFFQQLQQKPVDYYEIYDYRYPVIPSNLTNETEYYFQAELMACELEQVVDSAQPFAWHLWKENTIRNFEDIKRILDKEQGVCRHKTAIAFWLFKYLQPESKVIAVGGYEYGTPAITYQWSKEFNSNHVWLQVDGEIIDFTVNGTHYTPYYEVIIRKPSIPIVSFQEDNLWELYYSLNYNNLQKQYESDSNKTLTLNELLPWTDPKNKRLI